MLPDRRYLRTGSTVFLVLGAMVVVGVLITAVWYFMQGQAAEVNGPLVHEVIRGPFDHIVLEQGEVESSSNVEIRCEVKSRGTGGTQIIEVIPEGTPVKKGDLLVRLDSSALERDRDQQQITCNTSESVMIQAQNTYEAALISRTEYLEGTFKQEEQLVLAEVFVAEQNLRTARLSFNSGERLAAKGVVTSLQLEGDQFAVDKAGKDLEAAQTKLKVLREYTQKKMLKQFESDIISAKAKWEAEKSSFELEKKKLADIEDQMKKCEIHAPQDGQVVYANVTSNRGGTAEFVVEAGANVREGQVIIRLPDSSLMQVKAKINESRVTLVKAGMPVSIRLDAFGDKEPLQGEVTKVNQYAEPGSWFSSQVKEYATFIRILNPSPFIRPGLTAEVRIFVERRPEALQAPVQAIFEHGPDVYCLVKTSGENQPLGVELRQVKIGASNDKFVAIEEGLKEKEKLLLSPRAYLSLVKLPEIVERPEKINATGNGGPPTQSGTAPAGKASAGGTVERPRGGSAAGGGAGGGGRDPAQMFTNLDKDGDGKISAEEMQAIPEEFRSRMQQNDTNGDGVVDREEFNAAMARRRQEGGGAPGGGPPRGPGA